MKVKCIKGIGNWFTKGKIYDSKNNRIEEDNEGYKNAFSESTFNEHFTTNLEEEMENYVMIDGVRIELSEDTAEQFRKLKKKEYFRADSGYCTYFAINDIDVHCTSDFKSSIDKNNFRTANYFETKEEANQVKIEQDLWRKIRRWQKTFDGDDYSNDKFNIYYDKENDEFKSDFECPIFIDFMTVYFTSKEKAEECLNEFEEELRAVMVI